jgi:hypothetical protein
MKTNIVLILFVILVSSCNEKIFTADVNCDECYIDKPDKADLVISVTINYKYPRVPLVIYKGNSDANAIVAIDTADSSPYYIYVPTEQYYSVRAEYQKDTVTTYAVDGTHLKSLTVNDACDSKCYVIANDKLDVQLKKEFQ